MNTNEVDERVLAKLKMRILQVEQENAQTQDKKHAEMVDYICKAIKNEVKKAEK